MLRTGPSVFVAAILGLAVFGSSVRAIPPAPGKIAFVSDRDGSPQIYVMDAEGSNAIRLTNGEYYTAPAFSPDSGRIAFASQPPGRVERQIYVMSADGSNVIRLTDGAGDHADPTFSPDGRKIAFALAREVVGNVQIYVMNVDGSSITRLTNLPGEAEAPEFSPDGRKIAFQYSHDYQIYVMDADGSHVARETRLSSRSWVAGWRFHRATTVPRVTL